MRERDGGTRDGHGRQGGETWRVRVRDPRTGDVLGSGVLLGGNTVLTCAHVLPGPAAEVVVEFPEIEGAAASAASVREGGWFPEESGDRGDLALLRLHRPLPERHSAPLLRAAPSTGMRVEMCGYPSSVAGARGAAFEATVSRKFGERVQLNPVRASFLPRHGFSGGPVLDMNEPSSVLGLTVTGYQDQHGPEPLALAHMIPVETVVRYLPAVERWTRGPRGVEPGMVSRVSDGRPALVADYAERLARWLHNGDGAPGVYVTDVEPGTAREFTLQRALALADRELSAPAPSVLSTDAPETVPPVGSLDLAVDVRGRTAEYVAARVAERLNLRRPGAEPARERLRDAGMPLTLAFLGVDVAADPRALLELCGELADHGCRQLLVCHGGGARPGRDDEEELDLRHRAGALVHRVDELAGRLPDLTEYARAGLADARPFGDDLARLAIELARLRHARRAGAGEPPERLRERLVTLDARVSAADRKAKDTHRAAEERGRRRAALRDELETYRLLAAARLRAEDEGSAREYREAYDALYHRPFDPSAAVRAVAGYEAAVRRALDWPPAGREGEGEGEAGDVPTRPGDAPVPGDAAVPGPPTAPGPPPVSGGMAGHAMPPGHVTAPGDAREVR